MKVNRANFIKALESVKSGLDTKGIIEQSTCFVFKNGEVVTFNDKLSCKGPSLLDPTFEGAVQGQKLLDNLNKWKEEEIEVKPKSNEISFLGKGDREASVRLESKITLPISAVEEPVEWQRLNKDFMQALEVASQCTSKDESQFKITCVHIDPKYVEAGDNYQICRWNMKTRFKCPTLIRYDTVRHLTSVEMIEFSETKSWVHFKNANNLVISCKKYTDVEKYPDWSKYLEVTDTIPITFPEGLVEEAKAAQDFSSENADNNQIKINIKDGRLMVRGDGVTGRYKHSIKMDYVGSPISFLIPPQVLVDIVKKHNKCLISSNRLKAEDADRYTYISCLTKTKEEDEEPKPEVVKKKKKIVKEEVAVASLADSE